MSTKIAVAICVHHKPYLAMASLISLLAQDRDDFDLFILSNVGNAVCPDRPGYDEYNAFCDIEKSRELIANAIETESSSEGRHAEFARRNGINAQLSPFDDRLREVCRLNGRRVFHQDFENDHSLDSGCWLKFLRSGLWKDYDIVFTFQEGTLLTSRGTLGATVDFMRERDVHFIAGAHMKSLLNKSRLYRYNRDGQADSGPIGDYHDRMIARTIEILSRDPEFSRAFDLWPDDERASREFHVRDFEGTRFQRFLAAVCRDRPLTGPKNLRRFKKLLRLSRLGRWPLEFAASRLALGRGRLVGAGSNERRSPEGERIFVDGKRRRLTDVAEVEDRGGVFFHKAREDGWYGCACNHVFDRKTLETLSERFDRHGLYEVIDLPFSGTFLEFMWGVVPSWCGVEQWFFDGYHRVTKDAWSGRRDDTPKGMSMNLNRYFRGWVVVEPNGDYLRIVDCAREMEELRNILPLVFWRREAGSHP